MRVAVPACLALLVWAAAARVAAHTASTADPRAPATPAERATEPTGPLPPGPCALGERVRVRVDAPPALAGLAAELAAVGTKQYPDIARYVGAQDCAPIQVTLHGDLPTALAAQPAWHLPPWAAGAARPGSREILLTVHARGQRHDLLRLLRHELAHVALGAATGGHALPRWFEEGVSRRAAGEDDQRDDHVLAEARLAGRLQTLEGLQVAFPGSAEAAAVAYAVSGRALELLEAEQGPVVVSRIGDGVRRGVPFDDMLHEVSGRRTWQLSGDVERSVETWHAWLTLTREVDWGMALGAGLLCLAGWRVRSRSRRRLAAWQAEDEAAAAIEAAQAAWVRWTARAGG